MWFGIIGAPLLALIAFVAFRKKFPKAQSVTLAGCGVFLAVVILCCLIGISFIEPFVNLVLLVVVYLAYCYLVFSCYRIPSRILRAFVLVVLCTPILVGYLMGTVGSPGLVFIAGDYDYPPIQTQEFQDGIYCQVIPWGAAMSDEGNTVYLYKRWSGVPFLKRELQKIVIDFSDPQPASAGVSCEDALARYKS